MKIINLEQNSKDWVIWRSKGIGASDMPAIMGDSPWTSKFELWAQKAGLMKRPEPNVYQLKAMERGHELEPIARAKFEEMMKDKYPALCAQHSHADYLKISLDGFSKNTGAGLEIKAPSIIDHKKALKGKIPDKYVAQVQYQMAIAEAEQWWYVSYHDNYEGNESLVVVGVVADRKYQAQLLREARVFWGLVKTKTPPLISVNEALEVFGIINKQLLDLQNTQKLVELTLKALK